MNILKRPYYKDIVLEKPTFYRISFSYFTKIIIAILVRRGISYSHSNISLISRRAAKTCHFRAFGGVLGVGLGKSLFTCGGATAVDDISASNKIVDSRWNFPRQVADNALQASSATTSSTDSTMHTNSNGKDDEDPYIWLEEVESSRSLDFAKNMNEQCLLALGDPTAANNDTKGTTYERVLQVLDSNDRIPHVSKFGIDDESGEDVLFNFWKDGKNPKGIWRKTTLTSYKTTQPQWTTVIDLDELGKKENTSWVWKGARPLPRMRDVVRSDDGTMKTSSLVTRALLLLSRGGADATIVREFDLVANKFVDEGDENAFNLPEAKTRASYKSRNVLFVGSDFGPGSMTDSGYPRTVREWVRGTLIDDSPTIFEGEEEDVSVSAYIDDQRNRGGGIFEVRQRALTFYTSRQWARRVNFEHLLPPDDPERIEATSPPDFVELNVQRDAEIDLFGNLLLISLRSDWSVREGISFVKGSLIAVDFDSFISKNLDECSFDIIFEPTVRTALETYTSTKNYIILSIMDNVKSKMDFLHHNTESGKLTKVGGESEARIRATHSSSFDSHDSDLFWFTTSSFTQPSTLYLADAALSSNCAEIGGDNEQDSFVIERLKSLPPQYDASGLNVIQKTATSKDGTQVPFFIIMKEGTKMNGNTPTLLYGYGGFEVSLGPHYTATAGIAWLERGGVYVEANIRGGGEFGPGWHQAALKANRNKCYEDFISVAEELCDSSLCRPSTLGIRGGSNGGLLMGNMLVMRPDLFGAIHCAVPLLDMKRYHVLLAGASWMAEYGDPSTDDWEKFLHKYSPYHNINPNSDYPPILFTTSTRDDRVHPAHARKMVKKLADVGGGRWPVYYYENIEGGHGGAADSKQNAFMTSLAYDFLWSTLSKGATHGQSQ